MRKGTKNKAYQLKKTLARAMKYNIELDNKLAREGHLKTEQDVKRYSYIIRAQSLISTLIDEL